MEDRIEIKGVWYVRESEQTEKDKIEEFDIYESETLEVDEDTFSIKAQRTKDEYGAFDYLVVFFKRKTGYKEEWDSKEWMSGVADRVPKEMKELRNGTLSKEEEEATIQLIDKMRELKWI